MSVTQGHTRYSTHGSSDMVNIQPFVVETIDGGMAIAHNGELVNAPSLRRDVSVVFITAHFIIAMPVIAVTFFIISQIAVMTCVVLKSELYFTLQRTYVFRV